MALITLFLKFFFICLLNCVSSSHARTIIHTTSGPIRGVGTGEVKEFLGIPYGTAKRFEPPMKVKPWTSVLEANHVGPMCYQACPSYPPHLCLKQMSEDCLSLNVWTPVQKPKGDGYAVMVFIHGGDFVSYSGASPLFDGREIVKRGGVIVVTINYRLGAFGFLSTIKDGVVASGNNGLLDQQVALEWIWNNIKAFGGDRNKITLFGQSAGAESILIHLNSAKMENYFQRAIVQSSPLDLPFRSIEEAAKQTEIFKQKLGCTSDKECLKTKSSEEVLQAQLNTPAEAFSDQFFLKFQSWGPVIDGHLVTGNLETMALKSSANKDIIIGTVSGEGLIYVHGALPQPLPALMLPFLLSVMFKNGFKISTFYDVGVDARDALSNVVTDGMFYCPAKQVANYLSPRNNVWLYEFDQSLSFDGWGEGQYCNGKVCHGGDLPFLFDTPYLVGYNVTTGDRVLSKYMISYWTNFAKYGNPNDASLDIKWPKYESQSTQEIILKEPSVFVTKAGKDVCSVMY